MEVQYVGQYVKAKNYDVQNLEWNSNEVKEVDEQTAIVLLKNKDFKLVNENQIVRDLAKISNMIINAKNIQELRKIAKDLGMNAKDTDFAELKKQLLEELR